MMNNILRFIGVNRDTRTAGPGKRLEFFTKGCIRGVIAPCQGCFNESTWTFEGHYREMTVAEVVDVCHETAWNRQVTFCGGEPILQAKSIAQVAKRLKELDHTFHFVMYTAYKLDTLMKYGLKFTWLPKHGEGMKQALIKYCSGYMPWPNKIEFTILTPEDVKELMKYIDLIVDGDYQYDKRLTKATYMHEGWFIGSANQRVINCRKTLEEDNLSYWPADEYNEYMHSVVVPCKCCGHHTRRGFCSDLCQKRFSAREEELKLLGGA
ncbi:TPA: 4Fe-4S cluster-binding domain-containing protein [Bacillus cereus]|nr:4Fe-4S cluster-binding domain-containing protein [Bacillus cereus]